MAFQGAIKAGRAFVELFADHRQLSRDLATARRKLRAWGRGVSRMGQTMARASAALLLPIAFATRRYIMFADAMARVGAVTQATAVDMQALTATAKELGRTTSFTAVQVAEGMEELGRAGFKTAEIIAAIPNVLNLARSTTTEMGLAARIAAQNMRAFNLDASDMTRIADVLVATANNSTQTLEELGESLKFVAPLAVEAGETLETTAAAIAQLADNGIRGTRAGTGLARAFKNLTSSSAQRSLKALNVEVADAANNLRPLTDIMFDLDRATTGKGSVQRLGAFEELFGRGQAAALKLAGGSDAVKDFMAILDAAGGTARRTAEAMDNTLGGALRRLLSAFEGVQIAIGEAQSESLRGLMRTITAVFRTTAQWIETNQQLTLSIIAGIAAFGAAGVALMAIGGIISLVGFTLGGLSTIFTVLVAVLGAVFSQVGLVVAIIAAAVVATALWTETGKAAVAWLGERFRDAMGIAKDALGGIVDALKSGDFGLAARILWLGVLTEFAAGAASVMELLGTFWFKLQAGWITASKAVAGVWVGMYADLRTATTLFMSWWEKAQGGIGRSIARTILDIQSANMDFKNEEARQAWIDRAMKANDEIWDNSANNIEAEKNARLIAIEDERVAMLAALDQVHNKSMGDLVTENNARITFYSDAEKLARAALAASIAAAGVAAEEESANQEIIGTLKAVKAEVQFAIAGSGVGGGGRKGTFSSAAQGRLFSDDGVGRLVRLQELSVRLQEDIEQHTRSIAEGDNVENR